MSTNFPTSKDSYVTKVDNVDAVYASHVNDLQDAIEAIETKIGIDSSSVNTTLDYFLKNASGAYRTHKHDGSSDDGAAAVGPLTGLTIANDIDVGDYQVRMKQLYADVPTGTAPLVVSSTTVVSNLNADQVDGLDSTSLVQTTGNQSIAGNKTFTGTTTLADGAVMASSAAPTADAEIANKKYVDDSLNVTGKYDSGWFAASTAGTYTKTHNLGTTYGIFKLYGATSAAGANMQEIKGLNDNFKGSQIQDITTTQCTVQVGANSLFTELSTSGNNSGGNEPTSGYLRVVAISLE